MKKNRVVIAASLALVIVFAFAAIAEAATLTGRVKGKAARGAKVKGSDVLIYKKVNGKWTHNFQYEELDSKGRFKFEHLPKGTYSVLVFTTQGWYCFGKTTEERKMKGRKFTNTKQKKSLGTLTLPKKHKFPKKEAAG